MKIRLSPLIFMLTVFLSIYTQDLKAQNTTQNLLSNAISDETLWESLELDFNQVSKIYILDHGVTLELPDTFDIDGIPVEIIQKNQVESIRGFPLIHIHTLHVENNQALLRIYLSKRQNGKEQTTNAEFQFIKKDLEWQITKKQ